MALSQEFPLLAETPLLTFDFKKRQDHLKTLMSCTKKLERHAHALEL